MLRRRSLLLVALGATAVVVAFVLFGSGRSSPELIIDDSVAADFTEVATEDWERFVAGFPAQHGCIGRVTLVADYTLDDLARYDPGSQTMAVRVPAPRVLLDRALIHELAHHLEFSCPSQVELRPAFLAALGRTGAKWFEGEEWEQIPSEIFAEAVVEYVLDERGRLHTEIGLIDPAAVDVVASWATES